MVIMMEEEIAEAGIKVLVGKIDMETTSEVGGIEIIPGINGMPQGILHPQGIITKIEVAIDTQVSPPIRKGLGILTSTVNHDLVQGTHNSLMDHPNIPEGATLDPLEKGKDHPIPSLEIGIDQETEDHEDVVVHDLIQEVEKDVIEDEDLIIETIIDNEVVADDSRQDLNHLIHPDTGRHLMGLPIIPKIQKNLL